MITHDNATQAATQPVQAATQTPVAKPVVTKPLTTSSSVAKVVRKAPTKPVAKKPAAAPKAAVKSPATAPSKPPVKSQVKPAVKPAVKPTLKAPLKAATKSLPKLKATAAKSAKEKKPKLVRDSFTIPKGEYTVLDELKQRAGKLSTQIKKSELLRAGIKALAAMSDAAFLSALKLVPTIKTGRPAKG
jgi:hypothetical protein